MATRRSRSAVKSFARPGADEQHARALPAAHGRGEQLERLALELAARPRRGDLAAGRGVEVGLVRERVVFEDRE